MDETVHILIVEDDLITAVAIEEALLEAGFAISGIVQSYQEAIRVLENKVIHAAIIDVGLAGQPDGVATARALLRHHWMPFIYLTGTNDAATFERAKATNPHAFLNKPLRPRELVQQLQLAMHNFQQRTGTTDTSADQPLYLPTELGYARVAQSAIYYLEAARNFTALYLTDEALRRVLPAGKVASSLMLTGNLGYWGKYLSPRSFYRLSKSLIVNLDQIDRVETQQIVVGNRVVPLPEGARRPLLDRLNIVRTR